jgi:PIN domain nuclease of toxin-antitoxin system
LIYLDSHIVVWLYAGQVERFRPAIRALLNEHDILISPIVRLELCYLHEIQRVTVTADTMIADLSARIGLRLCDKDFRAVVGQAIPLSWTRDPFDRLLVANAGLNDDLLVTADQNILQNYPHARW